ncbi:MAG: aldo/keto reductase [Desulfobulbaceae bacterium]|nr:aldo/keto reductase [Desulfobulbaceae bacterium]
MQADLACEAIQVPVRRFGRTGLAMPVITAGLMRAKYSWNCHEISNVSQDSQDNLEQVVDRALSLGINHLETARAYGTAESQLGAVLKKYPRESYILQTKVAPSSDPEEFSAAVIDSLGRLGVAHVDLLAIHGVNDFETLWQVCRKNGCLAAARRLRDLGKVRFIGFSGHGPTDVLLEAIRCEEYEGFDYLNLHWYTIFQAHTSVIEEAAARDLGVLIISPSDKGGMLHSPPQKLVDLSHPLTPMQFNDLFCLSRDEIHTITVGAARPDDFNEHVSVVRELKARREQVGKIYMRWQSVMREATGMGRPDENWTDWPSWTRTPGYINISFILWLYNLAVGWDLLEYGRSRYRQLGLDVRWVPGNNAAAVQQYDFAKVAERAGVPKEKLVDMLNKAHKLLSCDGPTE